MNEIVKAFGLRVLAQLAVGFLVFVACYPFVVGLAIKWIGFIAHKAGIEPQMLTYCCFLASYSSTLGERSK